MIKNVNQSDGLEEVKEKLNEVINTIVWDNPTKSVEKIAKNYVNSHETKLNKIETDIKSTLKDVVKVLESVSKNETAIKEYKKEINNFTETVNNKLSSSIEELESVSSVFISQTKKGLELQNEKSNKSREDFEKLINKKLEEEYKKEINNFIETVNKQNEKSDKSREVFEKLSNKRLEDYIKTSDKKLEDYIKTSNDKYQLFIETVNNITENIKDKMKQFITFYAQVGIHVKEMCDGKKQS